MIEKGYPADTMVTACYQYAEPVEFRQCFVGVWKERVFQNHETEPQKRFLLLLLSYHKISQPTIILSVRHFFKYSPVN